MSKRAMRVTVSGSFRRHLAPIADSVETFVSLDCAVLSPADPRVVDSFGDFLFVASDRLRSIRTVQNRHLAAISASDLLWLVGPDGYVGQSASLELGYAIAVGTPVFSTTPPSDLTLRQYVSVVAGEAAAISETRRASRPWVPKPGGILLDPAGASETLHRQVDELCEQLVEPTDPRSDKIAASTAGEIQRAVDIHRGILQH